MTAVPSWSSIGATGIYVTASSQTLPTFAIGDKGCIPGLNTADFTTTAGALKVATQPATIQSITSGSPSPWLLGTVDSSTLGAILTDVATLQSAFCQTYGTCCFTNLCNSSVFNHFNLIILGLSVLFSVFFFN